MKFTGYQERLPHEKCSSFLRSNNTLSLLFCKISQICPTTSAKYITCQLYIDLQVTKKTYWFRMMRSANPASCRGRIFFILSDAWREIVGDRTGEGSFAGRVFCSGDSDAFIAIGLTTSATFVSDSRMLSSA